MRYDVLILMNKLTFLDPYDFVSIVVGVDWQTYMAFFQPAHFPVVRDFLVELMCSFSLESLSTS